MTSYHVTQVVCPHHVTYHVTDQVVDHVTMHVTVHVTCAHDSVALKTKSKLVGCRDTGPF